MSQVVPNVVIPAASMVQGMVNALNDPAIAAGLGEAIGNKVKSFIKRPRSDGDTEMADSTTPQIYGGSATKPYKKQFKKKKVNKKKLNKDRKALREFKKKFMQISGVALQKGMFNGTVSATALPAAQQWLGTHIYSFSSETTSTQETGVRDIRRILASMTNTSYTDDVAGSTKFMIDTGRIDFTLANTGAGRIEADLYHITYGDDSVQNSLAQMFTNTNSQQSSLTSTAADKITINTRGATLFDLSNFLFTGKIRIISKEKLFMAAGDTYNFSWISKKPVVYSANDVNIDTFHFAKKNTTHSWICVFKSVTGDTNTAAMSLGSTRSYAWRVDGESIQGTALITE